MEIENCTVVGHVVNGMEVLEKLGNVLVDGNDTPLANEEVVITRCGELEFRKKNKKVKESSRISAEEPTNNTDSSKTAEDRGNDKGPDEVKREERRRNDKRHSRNTREYRHEHSRHKDRSAGDPRYEEPASRKYEARQEEYNRRSYERQRYNDARERGYNSGRYEWPRDRFDERSEASSHQPEIILKGRGAMKYMEKKLEHGRLR